MVAFARLWICLAISFAIVVAGVICFPAMGNRPERLRCKQLDSRSDNALCTPQDSDGYRQALLGEAAAWLNRANAKSISFPDRVRANVLLVKNGLARLGIVPDEKELRTCFSQWAAVWVTFPESSVQRFPACADSCMQTIEFFGASKIHSPGPSVSASDEALVSTADVTKGQALFCFDGGIDDPDLTAAMNFLRQTDSSYPTALPGSCTIALTVYDHDCLSYNRNPLNRLVVVSQAELVAFSPQTSNLFSSRIQTSFAGFFPLLAFLCGVFGNYSRDIIPIFGFDNGRALAQAVAAVTDTLKLCFCSEVPEVVCRFRTSCFDSLLSSYPKNLLTVELLI